MISAKQAVLLAISELARSGERPCSPNVLDKASGILARQSAGTITSDEAFRLIKPPIAIPSESGEIGASIYPQHMQHIWMEDE